MNLEKRIQAFSKLGDRLNEFLSKYDNRGWYSSPDLTMLHQKVHRAQEHNPWFTLPHILKALEAIGSMLEQDQLQAWTAGYNNLQKDHPPKTIGIVNAGNIPLVGFHDFLSVLISGHKYYAKLSSKDQHLPGAVASLLTRFEPGFANRIHFEEDRLSGFDAIIATGSNNTSRYFHYYFGKYPHIIRKNRHGLAVLTGKESAKELKGLAEDVMLYFGMGCRSVSKVFVPEGYDLTRMLDHFKDYERITDNHKYANNYDYNKSVFIINQVDHYDTGFLLLKNDKRLSSPISTLHYETYCNTGDIREQIEQQRDQIQCIVSHSDEIPGAIPFGQAQQPGLSDYADDVDTLQFLTSLNQRL